MVLGSGFGKFCCWVFLLLLLHSALVWVEMLNELSMCWCVQNIFFVNQVTCICLMCMLIIMRIEIECRVGFFCLVVFFVFFGLLFVVVFFIGGGMVGWGGVGSVQFIFTYMKNVSLCNGQH